MPIFTSTLFQRHQTARVGALAMVLLTLWIIAGLLRSGLISRAAIVLLSLLTAGCGVAATVPVEDEVIAAPFQEDTLEKLLVSNQEEVREQLGAPTYELIEAETDKSYFVYEGKADVLGVGIIGFFPLARRSRTGTRCSLLEFGADDRLQRFSTERAGGQFWLLVPLHSAPKNCRYVFWSQEELARLQTVRGDGVLE